MADKYIPIEHLEIGAAYKLKARNIRVGIWDGRDFHGIRIKFGHEFMDAETHYDLDDRFGTAQAVHKLVDPLAPGCK